jgi:hypothetical protein
MPSRRSRVRLIVVAAASAALLTISTSAHAADVPSFDFTTPVFGLATAPDGSLLVADAGSGVVELRKGVGSLIAEAPEVTDVAPIGRRSVWALTSGGDKKLYWGSGGTVKTIADIGAFEAAVNPDGGEIDSNPFDLAALGGGRVLVADAAANALLIADRNGHLDWVATLPDELVPTDNVKHLAGCPDADPEFAFVCNLPDQIPAQPVTTSVAVGPDGAYYVSELKGFPAPLGRSRIWRIEPGTRHANCGSSPECSVVADGFTSIVDINFGPDGTLYVVEIDEASWLAVELGGAAAVGGTVDACTWGSFTCTEDAAGLPIPIAVAVGKAGTVYVAIWALVPGQAKVITI